MKENDPGGDRLTEQIAAQLFTTYRLLQIGTMPALKDSGLRPPQAMFLGLLLQAGQLNMSAISRETNVTLSVATRFITRLENNGMVRRVPHETDRRQVMITLTGRGRQVAERLLGAQIQHLKSSLEGIEQDNLEVLVRVLSRVNLHLSAALPPRGSAGTDTGSGAEE